MILDKKRKNPCHCINLRRTVNVVSEIYDRFLAPIGLTVNQFSLIINLYHIKSGSISALSRCVDLDRTTLVRSLKPLLDRGLIEDHSKVGKRDKVLKLSELGNKAVIDGIPLWSKAQADIEGRLGKEGISYLYEIINLINKD